MRTRRSYFPTNVTFPRRQRKKISNIVEPELRTIVEMADNQVFDNRTMAQMLQAPIEGYEDAIVVPPINANNFELKQTFINLVQSNQFTDKIPRDGLAIIESKSKVRYSRSRVTDTRMSTNAHLPSSSPSNSFDLQQIATSLADKLDIRMSHFEKSLNDMKAFVTSPAPIKAMVNTRTDAELAAAVQNALQTLLPQIRAEIREEFHTGSGLSGSGGNPPLRFARSSIPVLDCQATTPVDAENWISHMEKIFDVMGCEDAFKTRLAVYKFEGDALAWWKAYKQAKGGDVWLITVTWAEFKELFFLQFFPRAEQEPTGTAKEKAKKFQWGLRKSTLNHLMCIPCTDVAQVANVARNYEIPHERDDDGAERPDKRQKSGDRHQPTTQQSSHRNHGHNNDRHGSDRRGSGDNHRSNNNYSGNNNRNGRDQGNRGQQSNRPVNSGNSS
nr:hypothetical protein [Tanacetum cinerariifolium]